MKDKKVISDRQEILIGNCKGDHITFSLHDSDKYIEVNAYEIGDCIICINLSYEEIDEFIKELKILQVTILEG